MVLNFQWFLVKYHALFLDIAVSVVRIVLGIVVNFMYFLISPVSCEKQKKYFGTQNSLSVQYTRYCGCWLASVKQFSAARMSEI